MGYKGVGCSYNDGHLDLSGGSSGRGRSGKKKKVRSKKVVGSISNNAAAEPGNDAEEEEEESSNHERGLLTSVTSLRVAEDVATSSFARCR